MTRFRDNMVHNDMLFPGRKFSRELLFGFLATLIGVALAIGESQAKGLKLDSRDIKIEARAIRTFDRTGLGIKRYGKLEFLGGLELTSPDRTFGGWSDIAVDPNGRDFLAVSDDGLWLRARLQYKGQRVIGIEYPRVGRLRALSGRYLKGKREKDAEGLALVRGTLSQGELLISFERVHRVGRFQITRFGVKGPSAYLKLPKETKKFSRNKGLEGVTVMRAGRRKGHVVAVGERQKSGAADRVAFVLGSKPFQFFLKDMGNMDVTSMVALENGDIIFLERRFRWSEGISMRLRRVAGADIKPGAHVSGEVLMSADFSTQIDNMEGLAVHRDRAGDLVLTLISDDNFNKALQRTVLLQFMLRDSSNRATRH